MSNKLFVDVLYLRNIYRYFTVDVICNIYSVDY